MSTDIDNNTNPASLITPKKPYLYALLLLPFIALLWLPFYNFTQPSLLGFFALVTIIGFMAARWKAGDLNELHEWGLGGRQFGTLITWFLVGGDFYTAYTVIAVPALVYTVGAYGFFALPYTIIVYPFVFMVMPRLWKACKQGNHITAADFVQAEYGGRWFAAAIAVTGIIAT
eukprot:gene39396-47976_t